MLPTGNKAGQYLTPDATLSCYPLPYPYGPYDRNGYPWSFFTAIEGDHLQNSQPVSARAAPKLSASDEPEQERQLMQIATPMSTRFHRHHHASDSKMKARVHSFILAKAEATVIRSRSIGYLVPTLTHTHRNLCGFFGPNLAGFVGSFTPYSQRRARGDSKSF
jgi:hypothetical protein